MAHTGNRATLCTVNPASDGEDGAIANKNTTNRFAQGTAPPEGSQDPSDVETLNNWNSEFLCVADIYIYVYIYREGYLAIIYIYIHI